MNIAFERWPIQGPSYSTIWSQFHFGECILSADTFDIGTHGKYVNKQTCRKKKLLITLSTMCILIHKNKIGQYSSNATHHSSDELCFKIIWQDKGKRYNHWNLNKKC